MLSIKNIKIKAYGQVQGVFFRSNTKKKADELDVKGWVKNEDGGTVKIEAEASEEKLKVFLDWCSHGEGQARVDKIETKEGAPKNFPDFKIFY